LAEVEGLSETEVRAALSGPATRSGEAHAAD
jgi:hypothetical protein